MALPPLEVEHVPQRFGFSCGPAALAMAIHALDPKAPPHAQLEMDVWRDATLVESQATSAQGLALAALRRGFHATVVASSTGPPFPDRIVARGGDRDALDAFFERTVHLARLAGAVVEHREPTAKDVLRAVRARTPCIVLTDQHAFEPEEDHTPHWVLALRATDEGVAFHDPGVTQGPTIVPDAGLEAIIGFEDDAAIVVVGHGVRP